MRAHMHVRPLSANPVIWTHDKQMHTVIPLQYFNNYQPMKRNQEASEARSFLSLMFKFHIELAIYTHTHTVIVICVLVLHV